MNHKQLTSELFRKHFPEWLEEAYVEKMMKATQNAFEVRGVKCNYSSLDPKAKQERWNKRTAKINENKRTKKVTVLVMNESEKQLSLFS